MQKSQVKQDIRKLKLKDLQEWFKSIDEPKYRAEQVFEWLWQKTATGFDEMSNLSKALRSNLSEQFSIYALTKDILQFSNDGTIKFRFQLHDGYRIESVLIPVPGDCRFTGCVSSQVGCSLSCKFCATGQMDRLRNLDAAEIFDQVVFINRECMQKYGNKLSNIVYMGMGEPLLNYRNVLDSVDKISDKKGLGFSPKRITVSTAGIAKMIHRLAVDGVKFNLALSLHAADDHKRSEIMPINEQNQLDELMKALRIFYRQTGNRISYEYICFKGFNDSIGDAKKLISLCRDFPVRVNIIEYNVIENGTFQKSDESQIQKFSSYLKDHGVMATIRRSRGKDIDAACGQLANKGKKF